MADGRLKASSSDEAATTISTATDLVAEENPSSKEAKMVEFSGDEETLIIRMYNLLGDRWSLIAGRIPGRSADEIEKYWNSKHSIENSVLDCISNGRN